MADAYGNFLFRIKNANLSNDVSNKIFENLQIVGKVGGLTKSQLDAASRNISIMLSEASLKQDIRQLFMFTHKLFLL